MAVLKRPFGRALTLQCGDVHDSGRFARPGFVAPKCFDVGHGTETRRLRHGHATVVNRKQCIDNGFAAHLGMAVEFKQNFTTWGSELVQRSQQRHATAKVVGAISLARCHRAVRHRPVVRDTAPLGDVGLNDLKRRRGQRAGELLAMEVFATGQRCSGGSGQRQPVGLGGVNANRLVEPA